MTDLNPKIVDLLYQGVLQNLMKYILTFCTITASKCFENDAAICRFTFLLQAKKKHFIGLASAAQLTDVNSQNLATMISHSFNSQVLSFLYL
jgi:hypothetical protein